MSARRKNPWDEFKPIASSRRPSRNTPALLLVTLIFCGIVGFAAGGAMTAFVLIENEVDRAHRQRTSVLHENAKWLILAGGAIGAVSLMGTAWKAWPKDLD